jgi:hypothetical protein
MPPIQASVVAALRLLGGRNAGTPLAIASTPVSAVHPDAKARRARRTSASAPIWPYPGSGVTSYAALSATRPPSVRKYRTSPVPTISRIAVMNR